MVKQKNTSDIILILAVVGILAVSLIAILGTKKTQGVFLEIDSYYDAQKNKIIVPKSFSIVNGVPGVNFIKMRINVLNKDDIPIDFFVKSIRPEMVSSIIGATITVEPEQNGSFVTGFIDVTPYQGATQKFCVMIASRPIPPDKKDERENRMFAN